MIRLTPQGIVALPPSKIARVAIAQGVKVDYVDCLTRLNKALCHRVEAPPLVSSKKPALFSVEHGRIRANKHTYITPWGSMCEGYCVPVGSYGLLRSICTVTLTENEILLSCPGAASRQHVNELYRAANKLGAPLVVREKRIISRDTVVRVARALERADRVILKPYGMSHVILAAIRLLDEEGRRRPCVEATFDPSTGSAERNRMKIAIDWMCDNGDEVACYAAKYAHVPYWLDIQCTE